MVDRALSLKPDLIALTGDIIDGNVSEIQEELRELARLKAPHGVYFVLGNHECYWNHRESIEAMKAAGATTLENSGVELNIRGEKIFVAGVNDPAVAHFKSDAPEVPIASPHSVFSMLLVHQPQLAKLVLKSGQKYHLQLSGHTHGGQFFPWNLAVRWMYPIHKGLGQLQDLWVYVSSGTGYWGPPIRLGTDGEVTNIVLNRYMARTPT
ncbi:MAG: metallophosphoesterase [Bdellovibrionales bacterium]|nr:metallophosphoesterase [Bdellovibrionales bacterium]